MMRMISFQAFPASFTPQFSGCLRAGIQKSQTNCELNICEIYINGLIKLRNMKVNGRGHHRVLLDDRLCVVDHLSPTA
jgi:hypothetical protein